MKAVILLIGLCLTAPPLAAQDGQWVEPDSDLSPPPVDEFLERKRRENTTAQERADARSRNVLEPVREARSLRNTLDDTLTKVRGAVNAFQHADLVGEDDTVMEKRRKALEEAELSALSQWGSARVKLPDLKQKLGEDHILVTRLEALIGELRGAQKEARQTLNRAG